MTLSNDEPRWQWGVKIWNRETESDLVSWQAKWQVTKPMGMKSLKQKSRPWVYIDTVWVALYPCAFAGKEGEDPSS